VTPEVDTQLRHVRGRRTLPVIACGNAGGQSFAGSEAAHRLFIAEREADTSHLVAITRCTAVQPQEFADFAYAFKTHASRAAIQSERI